MSAASSTLPKAVVFDLDGCLWYPDMYMLWGGGAPFNRAAEGDLVDVSGAKVRMLGAVPEVLLALKTDARWKDTVVAVASCTDEPEWAQECMRKFEIGEGYCIKDAMQIEEIHKGNKQGHLKNIAAQTGIALEEMLFLDNERMAASLELAQSSMPRADSLITRFSATPPGGNCLDVAELGCTVAWVPEGVTAGAWMTTLERFPEPGSILDFRKGG